MIKNINNKVENFRAFHNLENDKPLVGFCIGGWEGFGRYVKNTDFSLKKGIVGCDDINPSLFEDVYSSYVKTLSFDDDLMRCIEPIPSIPWSEASSGCRIEYTGQNFWSKAPEIPFDSNERGIPIEEQVIQAIDDMWIETYEDFIQFLLKNYSDRLPVGQAILRGPLDILAAVRGDENMLYSFYDYPEIMKELISIYTERFIAFLKAHKKNHKSFMGGSVVGQYYIWTPGTCSRLQNDAMSMLSPQLYEEFVLESDIAVSSVMEYNLYHIHSTAFHLLDLILKNDRINIIQISKDEGMESIEPMIDDLEKIQKNGRCLLLKGRLDNKKDLDLIRERLDYKGLCLQFVVETEEDARQVRKQAEQALVL